MEKEVLHVKNRMKSLTRTDANKKELNKEECVEILKKSHADLEAVIKNNELTQRMNTLQNKKAPKRGLIVIL